MKERKVRETYADFNGDPVQAVVGGEYVSTTLSYRHYEKTVPIHLGSKADARKLGKIIAQMLQKAENATYEEVLRHLAKPYSHGKWKAYRPTWRAGCVLHREFDSEFGEYVERVVSDQYNGPLEQEDREATDWIIENLRHRMGKKPS